ncbi:MAG: MBL fold metallo-hydrolase [Phycisphaerae bacterium]|nr:MBL fold metallo-hydrolase [Phycisphaerae bacterium]
MAEVTYDVLVIGGLKANKFWGEGRPVRSEHSTSILVRSGKRRLIVDPGWPADVMEAALYYRTGLKTKDVTDVFLTHFDRAHREGIEAFAKAKWWMSEEETGFADAELPPEDEGRKVLARIMPVPERLAAGVDVFPTHGHTPGHCSLLVYSALENLIITGDAVPTREHFERGELGDSAYDLPGARASLQDIMEIADILVPGHDNIFLRRGMGGM